MAAHRMSTTATTSAPRPLTTICVPRVLRCLLSVLAERLTPLILAVAAGWFYLGHDTAGLAIVLTVAVTRRLADVLGEALGELVRELRILGDTVEGAAAALGRSAEAANDAADRLDNIADTLTDLLVDRDRLGLHPGHGHGASGGVG